MSISRRLFLRNAALSAALLSIKGQAIAKAAERTGIKDFYKDDFRIGTAVATATLTMKEKKPLLALIAREFNAITPENCMKWEPLKPQDKDWHWEAADKFVEFGEKHKMYIVGHNLVWHSQVPKEVFLNESGGTISKEALTAKMQDHIATLAGRYKGRIQAWDVVNEAVEDDGSWRKSPWYNIMGEDFIAKAFTMAHEVDPKAHLIYNDYNTESPIKRNFIVGMIKNFKKQGVPIHGVGMQEHLAIDGPSVDEIEKTLIALADAGVRAHITELDIDVLPSVWNLPTAEVSTRFEYKPERDPYIQGLPKDMEEKLAKRYEDIFKIYLKHRDKIERVTLWGTADNETWLNDFPIKGRTNYPLLFDRNQKPKPAYFRLLDLKK
uniref:GH10 xylanase n=1 Tax=soil metagenome TaxID=410658 RepID=UPI000384620F|nr:GH10 family xylanase [uncultured bacterium]